MDKRRFVTIGKEKVIFIIRKRPCLSTKKIGALMGMSSNAMERNKGKIKLIYFYCYKFHSEELKGIVGEISFLMRT